MMYKQSHFLHLRVLVFFSCPLNEAKPEVFLFSSCCLHTYRLQMTFWYSCWLGSYREGTEGGGTVMSFFFYSNYACYRKGLELFCHHDAWQCFYQRSLNLDIRILNILFSIAALQKQLFALLNLSPSGLYFVFW